MEPQQVAEVLGTYTIPQIVALTKTLEEQWGVKATAPLPLPFEGGGSDPHPVGEEQTEFDVVLTSAGPNKIAAIKVVRDETRLGLKEAKDLVEGAPKTVKSGLSKEEAQELQKKLLEAGATVEVK